MSRPTPRMHSSPAANPLHIVDATMFWSATGGGVRRYLLKKHAWLMQQPGWSHHIAVPIAATVAADPWMTRLPAWPIPGSGGYRLPVNRHAMSRLIGDLRPSLIEAADPYRVAWAALDAAERLGVPSVAFCHSNLERVLQMAAGGWLRGSAGAMARRYARRLYSQFDLVLAPSQAMRQHLLDWGVDRVVCQPLGVDSAAFAPREIGRDPSAGSMEASSESRAATRAAWRRAHGFTDSQRILIYAGRFAFEKNLAVLAKASQMLGDPYVLLAIGAGPKPPASGLHVRTLPFMPAVADLADALLSADAFVHAGDQETFGLSVLEAMACGLPVVVRAAEGLAEMVDATVGMAVDAGTPQAFATAISALFTQDLTAMSRAARQRAEANDWNVVLPMLMARYRALIEGAPGRAAWGASVPTAATIDAAAGRP